MHWRIARVSRAAFQAGRFEHHRVSEHILITHHSSAQFIHSNVTRNTSGHWFYFMHYKKPSLSCTFEDALDQKSAMPPTFQMHGEPRIKGLVGSVHTMVHSAREVKVTTTNLLQTR